MKNIIKSLLCISPLLMASECGDNWDMGSDVNFMIVNSDYKNIVGTEGEPFHPDTIKVLNEGMEPQFLSNIWFHKKMVGGRFLLEVILKNRI